MKESEEESYFKNRKRLLEKELKKEHDNLRLKEELQDIMLKREREEESQSREFSETIEGFTLGEIDNVQLRQLDFRLRQLKCYRLRLTQSNSSVCWSGTLFGCYLKRFPKQGNRIRRIYLFIDNIDDYVLRMGYPGRKTVLASTFIHEMFHAYYDNYESIDFIARRLYGMREIEEPMAEFGMLCFIKDFDRFYHTNYHSIAYADVCTKLNSTNSYFRCYGLGASLYDEWTNRRFPKFGVSYRRLCTVPFYELYQRIQPAPRIGVWAVDKYRRLIYRHMTPGNIWSSLMWLYKILYFFNKRIPNISQHYLFNGLTGGCSNQLVYNVLDRYLNYFMMKHGRKPSLAEVENDFDNKNPKFGVAHIFEEKTNIHNTNIKNYEMERPMQLSFGQEIYPCRSWSNEIGKSMDAFIKQANRMFQRGVIDRRITILR